jgi:hypothetical protein
MAVKNCRIPQRISAIVEAQAEVRFAKANGKHGAPVPSTVLAWAKNRLNPFRSFSLLRFFYSHGYLLFFKGAHECYAFGPAKEMKREIG